MPESHSTGFHILEKKCNNAQCNQLKTILKVAANLEIGFVAINAIYVSIDKPALYFGSQIVSQDKGMPPLFIPVSFWFRFIASENNYSLSNI